MHELNEGQKAYQAQIFRKTAELHIERANNLQLLGFQRQAEKHFGKALQNYQLVRLLETEPLPPEGGEDGVVEGSTRISNDPSNLNIEIHHSLAGASSYPFSSY